MEIYMNEQDQVEAIKGMWNKYGRFLLASIAISAMLLVSWHWWQQRQENIGNQASISYQQMLRHATNKDAVAVAATAQHILSEYGKTPYATFAAFFLAKQAIADKKLDNAEQHLQWVLQNTKKPEFKQIGRLRLARVLAAKTQYDAALQILSKSDVATYDPLVQGLRGDIYAAMGKQQQAQQAYQSALADFPSGDVGRELLQMKLENL